mgnify:CR=1 FL=1
MASLNFWNLFTSFLRTQSTYPVILAVETFFDGEDFLIGKKDPPVTTFGDR